MQPFTFFISYRREDTAPIALLLKYEIEKRLQFVRVAVDVDDIRHGQAFPDRIRELIDKAHVTIVLIGKNWMPRRGRNRGDWVVTEIEHSLTGKIQHAGNDRYGLAKRAILPIFVDCEPRFTQFEFPKTISKIARINAKRIDYANWPSSIGPLLESIAESFKLETRSDVDVYPKPDPGKAKTQPVSDADLAVILKYTDYEGWYLDNFGNPEVCYLVKKFEFDHFNQAADFMERVSNHCRVLNHHPEWRNVFKHVTVALSTWDARRRVTIYDLNLALFMNKAAQAVAGRTS